MFKFMKRISQVQIYAIYLVALLVLALIGVYIFWNVWDWAEWWTLGLAMFTALFVGFQTIEVNRTNSIAEKALVEAPKRQAVALAVLESHNLVRKAAEESRAQIFTDAYVELIRNQPRLSVQVPKHIQQTMGRVAETAIRLKAINVRRQTQLQILPQEALIALGEEENSLNDTLGALITAIDDATRQYLNSEN